jgi:hypothetical protein
MVHWLFQPWGQEQLADQKSDHRLLVEAEEVLATD